ncbi:hypothetical protein [Microbulbifer epialgicus]|uniref:Uncharacterized protein n=1 Tax=Microbulbifer epialgicus TaxID=393907 RepID=A0ABV4NVG4_9GAMM
MNKKLYFNEDPPLKLHLQVAHITGILPQNNSSVHFLFQNYFTCCCNNAPDNFAFSFSYREKMMSHPKLHYYQYNEYYYGKTIFDKNEYLEIIIELIDNGYYVELLGNVKHILKLKYNSLKESVVFGYDKTKEVFHSIGFNARGNFQPNDISFDDFYLAYSSTHPITTGKILNSIRENLPWLTTNKNPGEIFYYKLMDDFKCDTDRNVIIGMVEAYQNGVFPTRIMPKNGRFLKPRDKCYGVDCYNYIIDLFKSEYTKKKKISDLRLMYGLWEHKRLIGQFIKVLQERYKKIVDFGSLTKNANIVEGKAKQLRFLSMDLHVNWHPDKYIEIIDGLEELREKESYLLSELVHRLDF